MARQTTVSLDNTFVKGLITEATGLNFPDHAWIEADNCIPSILGDTERRPGVDFEVNHAFQSGITTQGKALASYIWKNAGGDGATQIYVCQIGNDIVFYQCDTATIASPLSTKRLISTFNLFLYEPVGSGINASLSECQFTDGNGYLFIFHPNIEPLYCSYSAGVITPNAINVQIRDLNGVVDGLAISQRPGTITIDHQYNLQNQGWTSGSPWTSQDVTTPSVTVSLGSHSFTIGAGLPITNGDNIQVFSNDPTLVGIIDQTKPILTGSVTSYSGTSLTLSIFSFLSTLSSGASVSGPFTLFPIGSGYINTWFGAIGNYPSNADVWWRFKNTSSVFAPATTVANVTLNTGYASKGHYVISAFNQQRGLTAGISGLTDVKTNIRPKTGTWFQGRVWYAGPDDAQAATGDQLHYSWSENIYFSQIIENVNQFGFCYQSNDLTSEAAADLLPSDGGVIRIQGCGSIYKLFPVQNGLLVFAANGIKFITGSTGIGFTANDYTITDLSSVRSISSTSFINVNGYPIFWNEEGVYAVVPGQQGGLTVENLCLGTILSLYSNIPTDSKRYARGDYNPLSYIISWLYRDTSTSDISSKYEFNRILNYNTATKAFYTSTLGNVSNAVYTHDIKYVIGLGDGVHSESSFKYLTTTNRLNITFSEANDTTNWIDFKTFDGTGTNFVSTFTTGYKLKGSALARWQPTYVGVYTNNPSAYNIQGIWDYAISGNTGRFSSQDLALNYDTGTSVSYRRHKIRGHGKSLQLRYTSVDGQPFDIIGWAILESTNANV